MNFLRRLAREFPGDRPVHAGLDHAGTRRHPTVHAGLTRQPRLRSHCVPTRSSWLTLIERWFGELTSTRVRRGSCERVKDWHAARAEFLTAWNEPLQPFVWTATGESIQRKYAAGTPANRSRAVVLRLGTERRRNTCPVTSLSLH